MQSSDIVLTLGSLLAIFTAMIFAAALVSRRKLDRRALCLAPALWILNAGVIFIGKAIQPHELAGLHLQWNWLGKVLGIAVTLACCMLLPRFDRKRAGITLRQAPGSFWPTLAVIVVACVVGAVVQDALGGTPDRRAETWLYQLLMPSADEELFNRGLLLYYLARGLGDSLAPEAAIADLSVWVITIQFAFAHAFGFVGHRPTFSLVTFLGVLYYGYLLGWARQRTGSIVLPAVAHTLANTLFRL